MLKPGLFVLGLILLVPIASAQDSGYVGPLPPFSFQDVRFVRVAEDQASLTVFVQKTTRVSKQKDVTLPNGTTRTVHYEIDQPTGETTNISLPLDQIKVFDSTGKSIGRTEIKSRLRTRTPVFCLIGKGLNFEPNEVFTKLLSPETLILRVDTEAEESMALHEQLGLTHNIVNYSERTAR